jgi:hypothetical protein
VNFFYIWKHNICKQEWSDLLHSYFWLPFIFFLMFYYSSRLPRPNILILNTVVKMGIPVLLLILEEAFQLFPFCNCAEVPDYIANFYQEKMLNFITFLLCINWDDHMVFILHIGNRVCFIYQFTYVSHTGIPRIYLTWLWCINLFYVELDLQIFLWWFISTGMRCLGD